MHEIPSTVFIRLNQYIFQKRYEHKKMISESYWLTAPHETIKISRLEIFNSHRCQNFEFDSPAQAMMYMLLASFRHLDCRIFLAGTQLLIKRTKVALHISQNI